MYSIDEIRNKIIQGDSLTVLKEIPDNSVDCIVTSPPYWGLRDYGTEGQIGLEPSLDEYLDKLLQITAELKRILKPDGLLFWNHGDSYAGSNRGTHDYREKDGLGQKPRTQYTGQRPTKTKIPRKSMILQGHRLAIRMVDEQGWILRNAIIWHKPNHLPESVKDRFTRTYEAIFMFSKSQRYYFDLDAVRVPHKNAEEWEYRKKIRAGKQYKGKGAPQNTIGASFNYRVREAKKGHIGIIGVRATKEEMEKYDSRGVRKKTADSTYKPENSLKLPPEPTENNAFHPLGKNPGDVWIITTKPFPEAHFATFPPDLIEPMIKAGCPERVCSECGTPYRRVTVTAEIPSEEAMDNPAYRTAGVNRKGEYNGRGKKEYRKHKAQDPAQVKNRILSSMRRVVTKTEWVGCSCNAGWKRGIVLDPFMGAGTTALVAIQNGRDFIGIELNPEYIEIAEKRIAPYRNIKRLDEWLK